MVFS
jgi:hypothetical protein